MSGGKDGFERPAFPSPKDSKTYTMKRYISIIAVLLMFMTINGCKKEETYAKFQPPVWKEDETGKYPASMTAVISLPEELKNSMQSEDKLGAFIDEECRGLGTVVKIDNTSSVYFILIHGTDAEQKKIRFKYYSQKTSYIYTTADVFSFTVDGNYGTADKPEILELHPVN